MIFVCAQRGNQFGVLLWVSGISYAPMTNSALELASWQKGTGACVVWLLDFDRCLFAHAASREAKAKQTNEPTQPKMTRWPLGVCFAEPRGKAFGSDDETSERTRISSLSLAAAAREYNCEERPRPCQGNARVIINLPLFLSLECVWVGANFSRRDEVESILETAHETSHHHHFLGRCCLSEITVF